MFNPDFLELLHLYHLLHHQTQCGVGAGETFSQPQETRVSRGVKAVCAQYVVKEKESLRCGLKQSHRLDNGTWEKVLMFMDG